MTRRSVMAHCVHLSDAELELMAQRGVSGVFRSLMRSTLTEIYLCHAGSCLEMLRVHTPRQVAIAHCPTSNAYFAHGVLGVRRCWERGRGLKVGLGTDVAGGYQPSMLAALRAVRELSAILSLSLSLSLWPHSLTLSPRLSVLCVSLCLSGPCPRPRPSRRSSPRTCCSRAWTGSTIGPPPPRGRPSRRRARRGCQLWLGASQGRRSASARGSSSPPWVAPRPWTSPGACALPPPLCLPACLRPAAGHDERHCVVYSGWRVPACHVITGKNKQTKSGAGGWCIWWHQVGSFQVGKQFDALAAVPAPHGALARTLFEQDSFEERVEKFLHNGDDRDLACVWVQGRLVVRAGRTVCSADSQSSPTAAAGLMAAPSPDDGDDRGGGADACCAGYSRYSRL
jgi:hypothetical protein